VRERVLSQARRQRLPPRDHVKLGVQHPEQRILVETCRSSHVDIMTTASDKQNARKSALKAAKAANNAIFMASWHQICPGRCDIVPVIAGSM
jgi:hypothetical protein